MNLPDEVALKMIERGALYPINDHQTFGINYYIVAIEFGDWLEYLVLQNLTSFEKDMYFQGIMAFIVREDGDLEWSPTGKLPW